MSQVVASAVFVLDALELTDCLVAMASVKVVTDLGGLELELF